MDSYRIQVEADRLQGRLKILDTAGTVIIFEGIIPIISWVKDPDDVPMVLVGNKCDVEDERVLGEDYGVNFAWQFNCAFMEISAKAKINVHDGSTRVFPPYHPLIPIDYQLTGQPVLIGGLMGTCSYILTGTAHGMRETFGSTCHGADRTLSRAKSCRNLDYQQVLDKLSTNKAIGDEMSGVIMDDTS